MLGLYSKSNEVGGWLSKGLHETEAMRFMLYKDHPGCNMKKGLEGKRHRDLFL